MRKITKRSAAIIAAAVVGVGALGGVAMANGWFAKGTATGTAQTSDLQAISAKITLGGRVYPGAKGDATAEIANPNDFNVALDYAEAPKFTSTFLGDGKVNEDCQKSLGPTVVKIGGLEGSTIVPAKATKHPITLPVTVSEDLSEKCAGSEIKMTMIFGGHSTVKAPTTP
jgi:hypothetical protein